jgi:hypothetical protein
MDYKRKHTFGTVSVGMMQGNNQLYLKDITSDRWNVGEPYCPLPDTTESKTNTTTGNSGSVEERS